jgi:apolipoprotein N-acyltransferase
VPRHRPTLRPGRPGRGGPGGAEPAAEARPRLLPLAFFLLAVVGGILWALCFGSEPLVLAPWAALAPLVLLLSRPRAGWLGFVHGLAFWLVSLSWIAPTLVTYGGVARPLSVVLLTVLAAYLALFHAAFAALGARLWRRGGLLPFLALPALWVALEWVRTYLGGGFPWNLAGYAWVEVAGALPLSAWIGAYGISFLVVLASTGVAAAVVRRRWEPLAIAWLVPLLLLPLAGRWSTRAEEEREAALPWIGDPVRILQPNITNLTAWDAEAVARNYRKVFDLSRPLCERGALLVWPESAVWPFSFDRDLAFAADLEDMARRGGCTIVFNSTHEAGEFVYNSAYLLRDGAPPARYDKRHLVPFGEYVPFHGVFSFLDKLAREAGDFRPAERPTLLPWEDERIGMSICYEVVFPAEVAELTRRGATILATITNDAWYGDTAAPWQHFRAARFRAAENRRPMLRAAITGVSALIAPDGSVPAAIPLFEEGVIRVRVAGRQGLTPYTRRPWLVPAVCTVLTFLSLGWSFLRR